MSYLLKILKGANAGAEIALAEGAVTFGSGDACDIVLADATLAAEAFVIETSGAGLTLRMLPDGEAKALGLYTVFAAGEMEFAVGEDGTTWPELKRPAPVERAPDGDAEPQEDVAPAPVTAAEPPPAKGLLKERKSRFSVVRTLLLALLVLILLALCAFVGWWLWLHRGDLNRERLERVALRFWRAEPATVRVVRSPESLDRIAAETGLELAEADGRKVLRGNFVLRRERMAVAARARAADRDVRLDLSDDETLKLSAEETLGMASGGRIRVAVATNRCLRLEGAARTRDELLQTVAALCADVNRLRSVDDTAVVCADGHAAEKPTTYQTVREAAANPFVTRPLRPGLPAPKCPVAGLILTPYPCLVLRDGSRATVGAEIGGWVVEGISDREVTLKQGTRTFRWKP